MMSAVHQPPGARLPCIGDNTLAALAEGRGGEAVLERAKGHLADCADCRRVLARVTGGSKAPTDPGSLLAAKDDFAERDLSPGTRIGRYVVERWIGRGAMGTVYAATDPDLDRTVAVKLLRSDALPDEARQRVRTRLLREAKAMARLSHPDVITVHDVGAFGDQLFVAMEYVDGPTLRLWRAERFRTRREILSVYERAGIGLAAAHDAGLVHRDFKPDNVLVGRDGRVRVTDFGLARVVDRADFDGAVGSVVATTEKLELYASTATLTRTGTLLGTPAYMAPEQLAGRPADARSDIFSYCVALYEALYGERPFAAAGVHDLRSAIERGTVRPAPFTTTVPRWMRACLLRGLRADPAERFDSMRDLLDALRSGHARSRARVAGTMAACAGMAALAVAAVLVARVGANAARAPTPRPSLVHVTDDRVPEQVGPSSPASRADDVRMAAWVDPAAPPRGPVQGRVPEPKPQDARSSVRPPPHTRVTPRVGTQAPVASPSAVLAASASPAGEVGNNGALIIE